MYSVFLVVKQNVRGVLGYYTDNMSMHITAMLIILYVLIRILLLISCNLIGQQEVNK